MLSRGSWIILSLILSLLVFTAWYAATLSRILPFFDGKSMTNLVVLNQGHLTQMGDEGRPTYQAFIAQASQQGSGEIDFSGLKVVTEASSSDLPWTLTAPFGVSRDENQAIDLQGGVILSRAASPKMPAIRITTDRVTIYPAQNKVAGADLIIFQVPGTQTLTQAQGFEANIQTEEIHLLSQVQSHYDLSHF